MKYFPRRHTLPHELPQWVHQGDKHFISINCRERGSNFLATEPVACKLLDGFRTYETIGHWFIWLAVIMPDHVHAILTFNLDHGIRNSISSWKGFHAKQSGVKWQSGFFEHRLRNDQEYVEKATYVRMNPVRKNLVASPEEWPFMIDPYFEKEGEDEASG